MILRKYFEHPAITTDVIVGFPGETAEEFETTRQFIDKVNFYETHVFKYSKRSGTIAADMPDQVDEQVKSERSAVLLQMSKQKKRAFEEKMIGQEVEVLMEEPVEKDGKIYQTGHTKEYVKIAIESDKSLENQIINIVIQNDSQFMD